GAGLLLGSDAPQIFNVPGFSIQHELQYMIKAGLTPYEALKMGTVNPAVFFNKEGEFGMIKTGASADFLLLEANPLEDIENVQARSGVMVRGIWLPEEEIQKKLGRIAAKYAEK
ncbi:MAG: amidohydrolase family protein, partial [Bacteroidetes bacterium]|nr:amidohydrolase family protein [Bacteroidota bacterium]